jgi:6-pyruvoyltetrahydropterin/6-carboxytetrahydropterin synthase
MFQLRVEAIFSAAHAITIAGTREPIHGHDWRITAIVQAPRLDADGLVCDFHAVERSLHAIAARFHNRSLNDTPPFDRINPTAEHVAMHLATELGATLPARVTLHALTVTEAPGCAATYLP